MSTLRGFFWVCTVIGCLLAIPTTITAILTDSAPKQGAGAALACAFAVVPYCFARAIDELVRGAPARPATKAGDA